MRFAIRYINITLFVLVSLLCSAHNEYKSNKLELIANALGIYDVVDSIQDGYYDGLLFYDDRPIIVCVSNGVVGHIGFSLFSDSTRHVINSPALLFIERYSLELSLSIDTVWSKKTRMEIDKVKFKKGNMDFFRKIPNDSLFSFQLLLKDRKYVLVWNQGKKVCCEIEFPMHYDLIGGRERIELENNLKKEIERDSCLSVPQKMFSIDQLEEDTLENYYILRGDEFYSKGLTSNTYYTLDKDSIVRPYYDCLHIVESLSNLFSIANYPNNYVFNIELQKYGFIKEQFALPVSTWVKYCINQGCTPYFGVICVNDNCTIDCSLIMYNPQLAYLHAMKININLLTIERMEGIIDAKLTSYIMTSKIKKLFKEYDL